MELNALSIGQRIKQRRTQLGLNQTEVKNAVGVSSGNMSDLENGNRLPSATTLIRLSQILHVSTDYILMGDSPNTEYDSTSDMEESELLRLYRSLPAIDQEEVLAIVKLKYQRVKKPVESV